MEDIMARICIFLNHLLLKTIGISFLLLSYLSVSRYVGNNFSFGLSGSVNKIDKFVRFAPGTMGIRGLCISNPGDLMYYGVETIKYSFMNLIGF
jgi:hypothetical protein